MDFSIGLDFSIDLIVRPALLLRGDMRRRLSLLREEMDSVEWIRSNSTARLAWLRGEACVWNGERKTVSIGHSIGFDDSRTGVLVLHLDSLQNPKATPMQDIPKKLRESQI